MNEDNKTGFEVAYREQVIDPHTEWQRVLRDLRFALRTMSTYLPYNLLSRPRWRQQSFYEAYKYAIERHWQQVYDQARAVGAEAETLEDFKEAYDWLYQHENEPASDTMRYFEKQVGG